MDGKTPLEPYEAPKLWELGTVAELTTADDSSVVGDSTVSDATLKEDTATLAGALARLRSLDL